MTTDAYRNLLAELRHAFPGPRPDAADDEQFVAALAASVREALALRGGAARLSGTPRGDSPDEALLPEQPAAVPFQAVAADLIATLRGLPLEVHPRGQVNVNAQPSTVSLIASLLPAIFNPNMSSDGRGAGCSHAEREVAAMIASLIGYDPRQAGGVFTFGGTGTLLYGVKLGLEKACPDTLRRGLAGNAVVLASRRSHHTCLTAAGWLGIGSDQVWHVPVGSDNAMDVPRFRALARQAIGEGRRIAAIIATVGTTDAFGLDDVQALAAARDELVAEFQLDYQPHIHADAVIGWAWATFNNYACDLNPLGFPSAVLDAVLAARPRIQVLRAADSLGVDFHKTGFVPYVSSMVLVRDRRDFQRLARQPELMPYLFHSGQYHPGLFTLETTRAAGGVMAAWANLRWLGRAGLQTLLGHALEMTAVLRGELRRLSRVVIVNDDNVGPVTLFRVYPPGVAGVQAWHAERSDPRAGGLVDQSNAFNRQLQLAISRTPPTPASAAIGLTTAAAEAANGTPLVALKSYLLSPWLELADVQAIVGQLTKQLAEPQTDGRAT